MSSLRVVEVDEAVASSTQIIHVFRLSSSIFEPQNDSIGELSKQSPIVPIEPSSW